MPLVVPRSSSSGDKMTEPTLMLARSVPRFSDRSREGRRPGPLSRPHGQHPPREPRDAEDALRLVMDSNALFPLRGVPLDRVCIRWPRGDNRREPITHRGGTMSATPDRDTSKQRSVGGRRSQRDPATMGGDDHVGGRTGARRARSCSLVPVVVGSIVVAMLGVAGATAVDRVTRSTRVTSSLRAASSRRTSR